MASDVKADFPILWMFIILLQKKLLVHIYIYILCHNRSVKQKMSNIWQFQLLNVISLQFLCDFDC